MTVTRLLIVLVPAAAVAAGNYAVLSSAGMAVKPAVLAWLVASPLALALLLTAMLGRVAAPPASMSEPRAEPPDTTALRLLGLLQEEGRLLDFLAEDLSTYPDAQIGAAARGIHTGCRKALDERVTLEPVLRGTEGDTVTVEAGFDPAAIRLTGNVGEAPPFRGVLRHGGWRATSATLPARRGHDPNLLAPAEVEIS